MTNSLKKQTKGEVMNIPPGIDRREALDGTVTYRVRIRIKGTKPVSKTFQNLSTAIRWKRSTAAQIEKGLYLSYAAAEKHTVGEAINRYEQQILPHKGRDRRNVTRHLQRWQKEIGHIKLSHLTPSDIANVRDRMLSESVSGEKLRSNTTVTRYLASFSHVLSTATKEWQWLNENPCLKVKKPKVAPSRTRYLSRAELPALLQACKKSKNRDLYLIVLIALTTGARQGEILNLKQVDIDFDNRFFHIKETKNGDARSVPIADQVFQILKEQKTGHSPLLFPSRGDPKTPCCIRSAWEAALKRAGIINFTFHDLRHTTASYLAMEGTSLREIGEILGHKTMQMTKNYSHLSQEHKRKSVYKIETILQQTETENV